MTLTTIHNIDKGIFRLLNAPRDLPESALVNEHNIQLIQASDEHKAAFKEYGDQMAEVYSFACNWWEMTLDGIMDNNRVSRLKAAEIAIEQRMAGPAAQPDVVWLVRTYWLKCVEVNHSLADHRHVRPEIFLLKWLMDDGKHEWVKLLSCMPYWPIGLDENSQWC